VCRSDRQWSLWSLSGVKGARTSIRALSWPFAPLPVIMGCGLFSCVPRAVPGSIARGLVPALRS
jgi:hypothetical protein